MHKSLIVKKYVDLFSYDLLAFHFYHCANSVRHTILRNHPYLGFWAFARHLFLLFFVINVITLLANSGKLITKNCRD